MSKLPANPKGDPSEPGQSGTSREMPAGKNGIDIAWLLKMAWRDGRSAISKLFLFTASIALGIAAVVAIQSFGINLRENIAEQSRALMGADFIIDSRQEPNNRVLGIIDSLGGADAREINFASMAYFPGTGASKLVRLQGIEGGFPFYGTLETVPPSASRDYLAKNQALVDETVMQQFNLRPGDSIRVGNVTLPIGGSIISSPGRSAFFSTLAPSVFIPYRYIQKTGLIQKGSRIEYQYYFVAKKGMDLEKMDRELGDILDAAGADLDTHTSTSSRLGRNYDNFGKFLNLVAFMALLLGCIGIASAINIYIKGKIPTVAILGCLGVRRKQAFLIFLIQISAMGLAGAVIGTAAGLLLQFIFPLFLQNLLPVEIIFTFSWKIILLGLSLGMIVSVLFALVPLFKVWNISPLQALRVEDEQPVGKGMGKLLVYSLILIFLFLFSLYMLESAIYSFAFLGGMLVTFLILALIARVLMGVIKKFFPEGWSFPVKQGLRNLYRPNNQTQTLIVAIGTGVFLISTMYFTRDFLLAKASFDGGSESPNLVIFDIRQGEADGVAALVQSEELPVMERIPIVSMRVSSINGVPVDQLRKDSTTEVSGWVLNHEFRVTYRDSLTPSESIIEGKFNPSFEPGKPIYISVDENFAKDAVVDLGDRVTFNVHGRLMRTHIGSIRQVDWQQLQTNFSIVFPVGVLEGAPQFRVMTTRTPSAEVSGRLQQKLVQKFPTVSVIDLRNVLNMVTDILGKIAMIINFMALFSILTGIIVLIGSVRTTKYQRVKEVVLLRTLGAQSRQVLIISMLEYFFLGFLGALTGVLLSLGGSFLLAWFVFDAAFSPSYVPFLILLPGITLVVMIIGLLNTRMAIKASPLEVLRKNS